MNISLATYRKIFKNTTIPFCLIDARGEVVMANAAFLKICGCTDADELSDKFKKFDLTEKDVRTSVISDVLDLHSEAGISAMPHIVELDDGYSISITTDPERFLKILQQLRNELHDDIGGNLAALQLYLQSLMKYSDTATQKEILSEAEKLNRRTIEQVRRMSRGILQPVLPPENLAAGIKNFCERLDVTSEVEVQFESSLADFKIDDGVSRLLFQAAKELVRNALEHGAVSRIQVKLYQQNGETRIMVADDGSGFDGVILKNSKSGLAILKERIEAYGGNLDIESTPERGTKICVIL